MQAVVVTLKGSPFTSHWRLAASDTILAIDLGRYKSVATLFAEDQARRLERLFAPHRSSARGFAIGSESVEWAGFATISGAA